MSNNVWSRDKKTGGGAKDVPIDPPFMDPSLSPRGSQEHQGMEFADEQSGGVHRYGTQGLNLQSPSSGKWGPSWF